MEEGFTFGQLCLWIILIGSPTTVIAASVVGFIFGGSSGSGKKGNLREDNDCSGNN
jgi:hypothetical protein